MKKVTVTLSDMEVVVLGVVWRDGPCTAYHVRTEFVNSPATFWSGSQGAIYPLLRKLEKYNLITGERAKDDNRKSRLLTATSKGKEHIRMWYQPNQVGDHVLREFDALRTRVFFLNALTRNQQKDFFAHVHLELQQQRQQALERIQTEQCNINKLALQGLIACNEARQKWMKKVKAELLPN